MSHPYKTSSDYVRCCQHNSMDPRRVRDPRLARADPRLQNRPPSNSPVPTPPPQSTAPIPQAQVQPDSNAAYAASQAYGAQAYASASNFQNGVDSTAAVAGPSTYQVQNPPVPAPVPSVAPEAPQPFVPRYKTRPLFCIVCASNNVRNPCSTFRPDPGISRTVQNRSMEGHNVLSSVFPALWRHSWLNFGFS